VKRTKKGRTRCTRRGTATRTQRMHEAAPIGAHSVLGLCRKSRSIRRPLAVTLKFFAYILVASATQSKRKRWPRSESHCGIEFTHAFSGWGMMADRTSERELEQLPNADQPNGENRNSVSKDEPNSSVSPAFYLKAMASPLYTAVCEVS
jgi:hypothetical protein